MSIILPANYGNDKLIITPNSKIGRCKSYPTEFIYPEMCCCFLPSSAPDWDAVTTYSQYDIVRKDINNVIYLWVSRSNNNVNNTPYLGSNFWYGYRPCSGVGYAATPFYAPQSFILSVFIHTKQTFYYTCGSPARQSSGIQELFLHFKVCLLRNSCGYQRYFSPDLGDKVKGYNRRSDNCVSLDCIMPVNNSSLWLQIPFFYITFNSFYSASDIWGLAGTNGHLKCGPTIKWNGTTFECDTTPACISKEDYKTCHWWSTSISESDCPLLRCGDTFTSWSYYNDSRYTQGGYTLGSVQDEFYRFSLFPSNCGDCGLWDSSTSYSANACVAWNGKFYRSCQNNNENHEPEDDASNICETGYYWRLA